MAGNCIVEFLLDRLLDTLEDCDRIFQEFEASDETEIAVPRFNPAIVVSKAGSNEARFCSHTFSRASLADGRIIASAASRASKKARAFGLIASNRIFDGKLDVWT